jgi:hypothetical protein
LTLIHLEGREYFVVLTFHQIVGDGWSVGIFLRELFISYHILSTGSGRAARSSHSIRGLARWQRGQLETKFKTQLVAGNDGWLIFLRWSCRRTASPPFVIPGVTQSFEFPMSRCRAQRRS